jgi:glycosyltransferase involved in cell wall biosynthesis
MDELAADLGSSATVERFPFKTTYERRTRNLGAVLDSSQQTRVAKLFTDLSPDIVHLNQQVAEDGLDLIFAAKASGLPWVSTVHIGRSATSLGATLGGVRDRLTIAAMRYAGGPYVTVSEASRTQLAARFGIYPPSLAVIHNGVPVSDLADLATCRTAARADWGANPNEIVIGAVGRIEAQKDPLALIDHVVPTLERARVRLAWIGDGTLRRAFEAYAAARGIALTVDGWRADATTRLAGLDIFLLPSRFEGLPLALLEAMHAGLPVVVARSDGMVEAVEDGLTGYTCAAPDEWREAVLRLATNASLRERLGVAARAAAAARFSAAAMTRATLALYREVRGKRGFVVSAAASNAAGQYRPAGATSASSIPRVLHVTPTLDPAAGGPPVVVRRLTGLAAANGFVAGLLTTGGADKDEPGVIVLRGQCAALRRTGRRIIANAVAQADIVHLHTMWSPLVGLTAAEARRTGKPAILSPHGMLDPWSLKQKAWKKRAYFAAVDSRTIAGAARLLFTSRTERDNAATRFASPDSAVIALGADRPPEPPEALAAAFRAIHPDLADRPLLIFLGRLHAKKQPEAAIAAMPTIRTAVPAATLLMVGSGEPKMVANLQALAARLGLSDAVRFFGHLDGIEKWRALAASQLFLLPSRQENFAIAAAEALHAGVPVILTPAVAIWPDIVNAGAGTVIEGNEVGGGIQDVMATAAVRLLTDDVARRCASTAARMLADRIYTWEASASATYLLYREVIAATKG